MKIHGNRVYLSFPNLPEYKTQLSPEAKKEIQVELAAKLDRLIVYAVGELVQNVKPGDEVYVDPAGLKRGTIIKIEGEDRVIVSSFDISHTW